MNAFFYKAQKYILDNNMLPEGAHVVAGVSGGADSMCLLFVLMKLQKKLDLKLCAVHINHGIRGAEADSDERYVLDFCESHNILCKVYRANIPEVARREKLSEEEAGRKFRYESFSQALNELGWKDGKIAVAHNKNDVAETFLMNIFRGSGLYGLASIPPVRGNIVRPLLSLGRLEIEAILAEAGIHYCTDKTNFENDYTRNKLRNELIPYILENINNKAVEHIFEISGDARSMKMYLEQQGQEVLKTVNRSDGSLDAKRLSQMDPVLVREVLRQKINDTVGKLKDITREHIEQSAALITKPVGKEIHLPYGLTVKKDYDCLRFLLAGDCSESLEKNSIFGNIDEIILEIPGNTGIICSAAIPERKVIIEMQTINMEDVFPVYPGDCEFSVFLQKNQRNQENQYTKWFDYDKIKNRLKLRRRCSGDYLISDHRGSKKLLRRLMIDEKIPKEDRDKVLLIADGSHIMWIIGGRISEAYKITSQTRKILEIKIKGEE